jgi:hypothetical protein
MACQICLRSTFPMTFLQAEMVSFGCQVADDTKAAAEELTEGTLKPAAQRVAADAEAVANNCRSVCPDTAVDLHVEKFGFVTLSLHSREARLYWNARAYRGPIRSLIKNVGKSLLMFRKDDWVALLPPFHL